MNIGVCGTGTIASWCSDTIVQLENENIVLYGCATSPGFSCTEFAEKFGYRKIYDSFDSLMQDPAIDVVYIAVPNNFHYDLCMKAIHYGKNLICEKPFSIHEKDCREIMEAAHAKNLFVSEALWCTFLPSHKKINEELAKGTIGTPLEMNIYMRGNEMFLERVKHLETGGGVLLDEGPYVFGCMTCHFGIDIDTIESEARLLETGVDAEQKIHVTYKDGRKVFIHQQMDATPEESLECVEIIGTDGTIRFDTCANPHNVEILDKEGKLIGKIDIPAQIGYRGMPPVSGYEYEWLGYEKALREGKKECEEIPNEVSIAMSHMMDIVLDNAGIKFPF